MSSAPGENPTSSGSRTVGTDEMPSTEDGRASSGVQPPNASSVGSQEMPPEGSSSLALHAPTPEPGSFEYARAAGHYQLIPIDPALLNEGSSGLNPQGSTTVNESEFDPDSWTLRDLEQRLNDDEVNVSAATHKEWNPAAWSQTSWEGVFAAPAGSQNRASTSRQTSNVFNSERGFFDFTSTNIPSVTARERTASPEAFEQTENDVDDTWNPNLASPVLGASAANSTDAPQPTENEVDDAWNPNLLSPALSAVVGTSVEAPIRTTETDVISPWNLDLPFPILAASASSSTEPPTRSANEVNDPWNPYVPAPVLDASVVNPTEFPVANSTQAPMPTTETEVDNSWNPDVPAPVLDASEANSMEVPEANSMEVPEANSTQAPMPTTETEVDNPSNPVLPSTMFDMPAATSTQAPMPTEHEDNNPSTMLDVPATISQEVHMPTENEDNNYSTMLDVLAAISTEVSISTENEVENRSNPELGSPISEISSITSTEARMLSANEIGNPFNIEDVAAMLQTATSTSNIDSQNTAFVAQSPPAPVSIETQNFCNPSRSVDGQNMPASDYAPTGFLPQSNDAVAQTTFAARDVDRMTSYSSSADRKAREEAEAQANELRTQLESMKSKHDMLLTSLKYSEMDNAKLEGELKASQEEAKIQGEAFQKQFGEKITSMESLIGSPTSELKEVKMGVRDVQASRDNESVLCKKAVEQNRWDVCNLLQTIQKERQAASRELLELSQSTLMSTQASLAENQQAMSQLLVTGLETAKKQLSDQISQQLQGCFGALLLKLDENRELQGEVSALKSENAVLQEQAASKEKQMEELASELAREQETAAARAEGLKVKLEQIQLDLTNAVRQGGEAIDSLGERVASLEQRAPQPLVVEAVAPLAEAAPVEVTSTEATASDDAAVAESGAVETATTQSPGLFAMAAAAEESPPSLPRSSSSPTKTLSRGKRESSECEARMPGRKRQRLTVARGAQEESGRSSGRTSTRTRGGRRSTNDRYNLRVREIVSGSELSSRRISRQSWFS